MSQPKTPEEAARRSKQRAQQAEAQHKPARGPVSFTSEEVLAALGSGPAGFSLDAARRFRHIQGARDALTKENGTRHGKESDPAYSVALKFGGIFGGIGKYTLHIMN